MASNNNTQPRTSGDSLEKQVDKIMGSLSVLNKLLCSLREDPLGRSKKEEESNKQKGTLERSQSAPPALALVPFDDRLITRLQYHLRLLKQKLAKLAQLQTNVEEELTKHLDTLQSLIGNFDSSRVTSQVTYWIKPDLQGMETKISELLYQVPLLSGKLEDQKAEVYADQDDDQGTSLIYFPGIHTNVEDLTRREVFRQVKQKFKELDIEQKICLLSFAVFPENQEVHRTMLMYWWIGEGILPVKEAEVTVRQVLKAFTEKNLIEPVEERWKVAPSSYKMSPFVHSSVVILSKEIGLFDIYRQGKKPMMNISEMGKVCLVKGSSYQLEANPKRMPSRLIETVFNVSERLPDFTFSWFSEYPSNKKLMSKLSTNWFKSLKVFYLGRWERSKKRHIQVQDPQLMQCFNYLRNLRVLSFQGISGIRSLNSSVGKLQKLIILDLRECYDLKQLPEKIDSLGSLVYLDMTGCYMLEWIPLRLALLKNLEVLKGFVVSDEAYEGVACKLSYLKRLKKLRKLSIEINRDDLGVAQVMVDIVELKALTSLKVTWRRDLRIIRTTEIQSLSDQLKKLDLQRYPHEELPAWLHPRNLLFLKKLQIGGGRRLKGFGDLPDKATECSVEVLRLTSLPKLRVGWMELKQLYFPNLIFLENYECPRVTLTPCDGSGVWRSDQDD
ncbi:hypothetical protein Bca52824_093763 [Brassica carinata]|uniref:Disease resistance R13L4/SHOC-2-like LRR domain-containing protein n=1 Tax=Brassica carinata TaxID=52824 RepID=A0A8X7P3N1_BRACI|nr:hypothetical protein Bca52824_093763 [Brassica carinata]